MTLPVGDVSQEAMFIGSYRESLYKGIENICVDNRLTDISHAIQKDVEEQGYSVVKILGHGIGEKNA